MMMPLEDSVARSCSVMLCERDAAVEVIMYDVCPNGEVFFEVDPTCPYLCAFHLLENEQGAVGTRKPRGAIRYPHTNRSGLRGFSIYRPVK
jgi:hypothetical protein